MGLEIVFLIVMALIVSGFVYLAARELFSSVWPPRLVDHWSSNFSGDFVTVEFRRVIGPWRRYRLMFNRSPTPNNYWIEAQTGIIPDEMMQRRLSSMLTVAKNQLVETDEMMRLPPP